MARSVIVTGAGSGIGKAMVERFATAGDNVLVADYNEANGKTVAEAIGDRARFVRADVSDETDVEAMVATAVREFGGVDVICNNAGVGGAFGPVTDIAVEDWDYTFAVLVRGVFLGTKHAVRVMKEQGRGGAVVNTASVAGVTGGSGPLAYSSAKAAVINLTRAASAELARDRIRINAICPGGILTPLVDRGDPQSSAERLAEVQPWPEHGRPEDIAAAAFFLAGDDARFITGEALVVDGALLAAGPNLFGKMRTPEEQAFMGQFSGVSKGSTGEEPTIRPVS